MGLVIVLASCTMLVLAVAMTFILGWANRAFHVQVNPLVARALEAMPGANCGACGYVGCGEYAEAVAENGEEVTKCPVGGAGLATSLGAILGVEVSDTLPFRPVIHCRADRSQRLGRSEYRGIQSCAAANLVAGVQGCTYGCLGLGDCGVVCRFDAIEIVDGLARIDYDKCTGCKACAAACPRKLITMVPFKAERMVVIGCANRDFGKDVKGACTIGCTGCKICVRLGGGLVEMDGHLPTIQYERYEPAQLEALQAAGAKCPMKGIIEVGRPTVADLDATADEALPEVVEAAFQTTVDQTQWRG